MRSIGLGRNFRCQIGHQDTNVDDIDAEFGHVGSDEITGFAHHFAALLGERRIEFTQTVDTTQCRFKPRSDTLFGQLQAAQNRLAEPDRDLRSGR